MVRLRFIVPLQPNRPPFKVVSPALGIPTSKRQGFDICSVDVVPQCLEDYYHVPSAPGTAPGNSIAVAGYLNEVATEEDLEVGERTAITICVTCPDGRSIDILLGVEA